MKENDSIWITDAGLKLICYMLHPDFREDCACMHIDTKWYHRCFFCKFKKECKDEGIDRNSSACNYIMYHKKMPILRHEEG